MLHHYLQPSVHDQRIAGANCVRIKNDRENCEKLVTEINNMRLFNRFLILRPDLLNLK